MSAPRHPIPERPFPRPIRKAFEDASGNPGGVGAVYDRLTSALEAEAERVATFDRMDTDRTELPGSWPTLYPETEENDR